MTSPRWASWAADAHEQVSSDTKCDVQTPRDSALYSLLLPHKLVERYKVTLIWATANKATATQSREHLLNISLKKFFQAGLLEANRFWGLSLADQRKP